MFAKNVMVDESMTKQPLRHTKRCTGCLRDEVYVLHDPEVELIERRHKARVSSLGKLIFLTGATFVRAVMSRTMVFPFESVDRRYNTAAYAASEASQKPCI